MDYDRLLSDRVMKIKPSGIRRFFDLAESMDECIALGVGEPDFKTPWHIREKGIYTLRSGKTRYTANSGIEELRRSISGYLLRRFGIEYDFKEEVLVTVGGSEGIDAAIRAIVNPGDEVLVPEPSFVCYRPLAELAGGVAVTLPTYEKDNFRLTPEVLKNAITEKTKLLILPYPNNPTGAVMRKDDYEKIAEVLRGTDIFVISDEIYIELNYTGEEPVSFASIDGMRERTVLVNGFSKAYAMTGWRMGYICAPAPIIRQALKVHQFGIMCSPTTSQYAAVEALENGDEDVQKMREMYNMRRKYLIDFFARVNIPCFEPLGAFYVFPNISGFGYSSDEFCRIFLEKKKVAVVPGSAFGESGEGFVRISYAYSLEHLEKAMTKLEELIEEGF